MKTIYIKNLSRSRTTLSDLENLFAPFGAIREAQLTMHLASGLSEGHGYICFLEQEAATAALAKDGQEFQGRPLSVSLVPCPHLTAKVEALLEEVL